MPRVTERTIVLGRLEAVHFPSGRLMVSVGGMSTVLTATAVAQLVDWLDEPLRELAEEESQA